MVALAFPANAPGPAYGYIRERRCAGTSAGLGACRPEMTRALVKLKCTGGYYWNSDMFLFRASAWKN